ncbi:hypothetical protein [Syntrophotalea acetylenica]|uniref:Uncharacterized protein n=1 Tax=Syntrophotalea acetylenica TaxID=29542 RepID=A0A1L3GDQ1_SYNAC|nr:hypothetical protein [Syntrophotalea acetylenica]APG24081.1 hypothetical protein A7E75_02835 [Syntrophotalea acetylenica]APG44663.1 hypothetical protein A6070_11460 [Syntrophotalea acetylenica]
MINTSKADWQGPFILSLICALADGLQRAEPVNHSARANRLARIEEAAFKTIPFYPPTELTPQVQDLAGEFFGKIQALFNDTLSPEAEKHRQKQIISLVGTSVDDCRATIALMDDAALMQATLDYMDQNDIEGKTRRQVLQRRIRAIKKEAAKC